MCEQPLTWFLEFCQAEGLDTEGAAQIDLALVDFFDYAFVEGFRADVAEKTFAAVVYKLPAVASMGKGALPRARRALKSFRKLSPMHSRAPLPWEWVAGLAAVMHRNRCLEGALVLLTIFDTYARPSAVHRLRTEDLLQPRLSLSLSSNEAENIS